MYFTLVLLTLRRDVKLLSFGGEQDDEMEPVEFKKKNIARPDCKCPRRALRTTAEQKVAVVDNPSATGILMPESLLGPPKKYNEPPRERASEKEPKVHTLQLLLSNE